MIGRILLVGRLAMRDLRRHRTEAVLLLMTIVAATTTLTLGLVLHDAARDPYGRTRQATQGPDVVADVVADPRVGRSADLSAVEELAHAAGVVGHSGPFPVAPAELHASDGTSDVQAVGRDAAPASVDRPELTQGRWVDDGGAVIEASFAKALGMRVGDPITLDGRQFSIVGVAVTAAMPPYPESSCLVAAGCAIGSSPDTEVPPGVLRNPGLVWLTKADVRSLGDYSSYVMNLKLADPDHAEAFVGAHNPHSLAAPRLESWQSIRDGATKLAQDAQILLMIGAWLLGLLAVASVAVLVGARMADQVRRVGLLKAVGGTPGLVAAVLLAEYLLVALVAAAVGLVVGSLTAPWLIGSSAGLLGNAGIPSMTPSTAGTVAAAALGVAAAAAFVPAIRAARSSTLTALADSARPPRRAGWLIAVSARLPAPLLLAMRVAARRPRRAVLGALSIAVTVSGIYVALVLNAFLTRPFAAGYDAAQTAVLRQVLLVMMVVLFLLTAVNAVFITWATVLDNRRSSALARALGATPGVVSASLAAAQVLPALVGGIVGVFPGGFALFHAINSITGGDSGKATLPPLWQLLALVAGTVLVVASLTAVPARLGGRRPVTQSLQAELA